MKIVFLSYWSFIKTFALFSIVSANPTPQSQTISHVSLINNSFNLKSHFSEKDLQEGLKTVNKSKHNTVKKEKLLTSTTLYEDGNLAKSQNFSTVKSVFHIFQIKTERSKNHSFNKLNEQSLYSNQPLFPKIYTFPQAVDYRPEKRGLYFGTFYPMLYHRNHFNDYPRSFYHPFFHQNYDLRNINKRFMTKRQHLDKYVIGDNVYYPDKRFTSFYPQKVQVSKSLSSFQLQVTTDSTMWPYRILPEDGTETKSTSLDASNEISSHKLEKLNAATHKIENVSEYLETEIFTDLTTEIVATNIISLFKQAQNEPVLKKYRQKFDENKIINSPEDESLANINTKESNYSIINHRKQERSEPIYNLNNSKSNNLSLLSSSRVYYEKMPSNLNVSWFVYVSCSRERCQFTNSTNETELMNEGWILHNCTNHGCREMYPETETIQRFIGLLLLVFSICILKIVAFLLVFYYCRSIKLTKNESDEREKLISEEDGPDFPFKKDKPYRDDDMKQEIASKDRSKHSESVSAEKSGKSNLGTSPSELSKITSKVWVPPVQKVSPCLVAASQAETEYALIPKKCSEKKITATNNNGNLLKSKRKICNSSPKQENWMKCYATRDANEEEKHSEQTYTPKVPKIEEESTEEAEFLLMDLDEEICTDNSQAPSYTEKASSWEILLEKECKSFINFDLSDEENYTK